MKISYDWLNTFFENGTLPGVEDVEKNLVFGAFEVEGVTEAGGDFVLDVDVLPNRASDCLSHRGIAREVGALLNLDLARDPLREDVVLAPDTGEVQVTIQKDSSCSYYSAAFLRGVSVGESPDWLKRRLEAIGQKSINNIVDATNYVMFELGQPLHAFDADKLEKKGGNASIEIRNARADETIHLLGEEGERKLTADITIIADAVSDVPIAVAGVKGGVQAEVGGETTNIVLESARFDPARTRKASQAFKLRTDASARFENDIPDQLPAIGLQTVAKLILDIAGGELAGFAVAGEAVRMNPSIAVSVKSINALLGAEVSKSAMEDIFDRLGFAHEETQSGFSVTAPFERLDITITEDIAEEVGRLYGYENITSVPLSEPSDKAFVNNQHYFAERARSALTGAGFTEILTYSLAATGEVALANAFASDKAHLRSDLAYGISEALKKNEPNMPLLGLYDTIRIFEIGRVFKREIEELHMCVGVRVSGSKKRDERTRQELEAAKKALETIFGEGGVPEPDGETLEFDLGAAIAELEVPQEYESAPLVLPGVLYRPVSPYPFVLRDVALWTPVGTKPGDVLTAIRERAGELLVRADLFDEFTRDDRTSYAFHLVFQSPERTLSDGEVNEIMQEIETYLEKNSGWKVR
ncbi:MAG: phenylalanine--tRNA ligase subunit beta [bacterium]|nr:phenylalanine--tRNA ligase subunit beta [bacterium]